MDLEHMTPDIYRAICVLFGVLLGFVIAFRLRLYRSTYERQLCDLTAGLRLLEGKVKTIGEISTDHGESLAMHDETLEAHCTRLTAAENSILDWIDATNPTYAVPPPRTSHAPDTDPSPAIQSLIPRCDGCGRVGGDTLAYGARCGHCGGRMVVLDTAPEGPSAA